MHLCDGCSGIDNSIKLFEPLNEEPADMADIEATIQRNRTRRVLPLCFHFASDLSLTLRFVCAAERVRDCAAASRRCRRLWEHSAAGRGAGVAVRLQRVGDALDEDDEDAAGNGDGDGDGDGDGGGDADEDGDVRVLAL